MTKREIKNLEASVRQRLLDYARGKGRPFQEILQYYAMERFLYRLSISEHAEKFLLKGALMLRVWGVSDSRPTRDIDLLGYLPNQIEEMVQIVRAVCVLDSTPDALMFDPLTVRGSEIKKDANYSGVRIAFRGSLGNVPLPMQIDVGFGDVVSPEPTMLEFPTLLGQSSPQIRCYNRETTVAEKFEAMVKLGVLNSRVKDFYDLWLLSRSFEFEEATLATAIEATFKNRGTPLTSQPASFQPSFANDPAKSTQWLAFRRKLQINAPAEFPIICETIEHFLSPLITTLLASGVPARRWSPGGPWANSTSTG